MSVYLSRTQSLIASLGMQSRRTLATTSCLCGRKSRKTFDPRFPISPKEVSEYREGGSKELRKLLGRTGHMIPQAPGYFIDGKFNFVPEMIPEFVVPDLKDFTLKPYVSYKVTNITQSEFTAKDYFDAVYSKNIVDDFENGKLKEEDVVKKYTSSDES